MRNFSAPRVMLLAALCGVSASGQTIPTPKAAAVEHHAYFFDPKILDLSLVLQAPPPQDGPITKAELAELHSIEASRTPAEVAAAQADDKEEDIFSYRTVLGDRFSAKNLPITAAFSTHVHNDEAAAGAPLKLLMHRPRPYQQDTTLRPVCVLTQAANSYPSGHTISGYLLGLTLAQMVPEKSAEILARADDYAHNRLICGVHYRSDIEASRRVALVIFGYMLATPRFQKELASAGAETRQALGLPALVPAGLSEK